MPNNSSSHPETQTAWLPVPGRSGRFVRITFLTVSINESGHIDEHTTTATESGLVMNGLINRTITGPRIQFHPPQV